jgi:hypothetical protein
MTYRGRVKNGVVVFDGQVELPEGTQVKVDLLDGPAEGSLQADSRLHAPPINEKYKFWRLLKQFVVGMFFLLGGSWFLSDENLGNFLATFALLFCAIQIVVALGLTWMTRWALRKDRRAGQFGISTMLLMLFYGGLYCGIIRWLALNASFWGPGRKGDDLGNFLGMAVIFSIFTLVAIPFVMNLTESLLWFLVWLQKRRVIRRLVRPFFRLRSR